MLRGRCHRPRFYTAWVSFRQSDTHALVRPRRRGLAGARDEFLLAATAQNLGRLAKHVIGPPRRPIFARSHAQKPNQVVQKNKAAPASHRGGNKIPAVPPKNTLKLTQNRLLQQSPPTRDIRHFTTLPNCEDRIWHPRRRVIVPDPVSVAIGSGLGKRGSAHRLA